MPPTIACATTIVYRPSRSILWRLRSARDLPQRVSQRSLPTSRQGASTVEFAIVAPIVFFFILVLIQFAGLLMSQNVLTAAAREGGRLASIPSTLATSTIINAVKDRVSRGGIAPELVTVSVSPTALNDLHPGDEVRITVAAPINELTWLWAMAPAAGTLGTELTYYRE